MYHTHNTWYLAHPNLGAGFCLASALTQYASRSVTCDLYVPSQDGFKKLTIQDSVKGIFIDEDGEQVDVPIDAELADMMFLWGNKMGPFDFSQLPILTPCGLVVGYEPGLLSHGLLVHTDEIGDVTHW